jgi:transglutaminase-like putative cysteine protease
MRKSTLVAAVCAIIAVGVLGVVIIHPQQTFSERKEGPSDKGEIYPQIYGRPPDVSVSLSVSDAYLGGYPEASFTVTNTGGACSVSYTIFETAPQTGSFSLGEGGSQTVIVTGPQVRDIGSYFTSVQVTAANSYGSDSAQASANFSVDVEPFDADPYIDQDELKDAQYRLPTLLGRIMDSLRSASTSFEYWATPDSKTIRAIANELASRHPNDHELQAKEIYYWVRDWIMYDPNVDFDAVAGFFPNWEAITSQFTFPVQTIHERKGVCLNYALVLASLLKASGFNVRVIYLYQTWEILGLKIRNPFAGGHAYVLLYLPESEINNLSQFPGWIGLDATGPRGGHSDAKFGELAWFDPPGEYFGGWQTVDV